MIPAHDSALLRGTVAANQVPGRCSGMRRTAETNRAGSEKDFHYPSTSHFSALAPASSRTRCSSAPKARASPSYTIRPSSST